MNDILVVVYLLVYAVCFVLNCLSIEKKAQEQTQTKKVKFAKKFAKIALFVLFAVQAVIIIGVHSYFGGYWFLIPVVLFNLGVAKK